MKSFVALTFSTSDTQFLTSPKENFRKIIDLFQLFKKRFEQLLDKKIEPGVELQMGIKIDMWIVGYMDIQKSRECYKLAFHLKLENIIEELLRLITDKGFQPLGA